MFVTELDSFVQKFHQLWKAGVTAHLDLDAHAGTAWVGLRVQLGQVPGPVHHQDHQPHPQRRGPAYQRRQERHQAARAATEVTATEISASDDLPATKASNASDTEEDDKNDKSEDNVSAEQVKEKFSCDFCDFKSNWENGLSVHISRKHKDIEQLDGSDSVSDDMDVDDKYVKTLHYWEKGRLSTVFQTFLDVLDVIENSDLTEESKELEKSKVLAARKEAFGKDFVLFPPWSSK